MKKVESSDKAGWEKIISKTKEAKIELDEQLEKGRDRLLEISSFNPKFQKLLCQQLKRLTMTLSWKE